MKLKSIILSVALSLSVIGFSQTPESFKYQAVARDVSGTVLINQAVAFQISLLKGSTTGNAVFVETHSVTTNAFGLVNLEIGKGSLVSGSFSAIDWSADSYFVKIELDETGGTNYKLMGTSQLLSVPYALHAKTVEQKQSLSLKGDTLSISEGNTVILPSSGLGGGKTHLYLTGDVTDAQAAAKIAQDVGGNTQFIVVENTTQLTTLDFSGITEMIGILISNNSALVSISLSDLKTTKYLVIHGNKVLTTLSTPTLALVAGTENIAGVGTFPHGLSVLENELLSSVSFPALKGVTKLEVRDNNALSSVSFPTLSQGDMIRIEKNHALTSLDFLSVTNLKYVQVYHDSMLTTISFPQLISSETLSIQNNKSLTSMSFPKLKDVIQINMYGNNSMISLSFPSLTSVSSLGITSSIKLTTLSFPVLNAMPSGNVIGNIYLNGNALTSSTINNLLAQFVSITPALTNKIISMQSQTPPAPPTGQGLIDKQTLITNGNTVTTD